MHIVTRGVSTLLLSAALIALFPAASAAQMSMSECKTRQSQQSDNPLQKRALAPGEPPDTPRPWITSGNVVIVCDDAQLFADEVEYYDDTKILKARGHVNFIEGTQRITADHFEFNTKTKLGTFYLAQGIMTIAGKPDRTSMFGASEADAYFYGEEIDKIGPDKYRLKNGRFTTCVQPTPRWEFEGSTVTLVKDKRALLWNSVLRVKNVPVFYLPFMYYPINKENRATGLLMPSYGHSTTKGQTFSEAFFWAINRSQDATLNYEYTSKVGSGYGGEYRYIESPGSEGTAKIRVFNGKDATGSVLTSRSVDTVASMTQRLPGNWQFRSNVNFSNNLTARQLLQQDIAISTNSQRYAGANVQGAIGKIRISGEAAITDYFNGTTPGVRSGTAPRVTADWASSPIGSSKIYFGMTGEATSFIRQDNLDDPKTNRNLTRFDLNPTLSAPIGSLPYLSLRTSVGFRFTYWNEQLNAQGIQIEDPLHRQLLTMSATLTGPKFSRIFDTPGGGYATRWKHVIEPTVTVTRSTAFDGFDRVAKNDGVDTLRGGVTSVTYGMTNSLLAKRSIGGGPAQAQEVASIIVQQSYYSDALAAVYDTSTQSTGAPGKLGPLSLIARAQPSTLFNTQFNLDYDTKYHGIRQTSLGSGLQGRILTASVGWSKQFFIKDLIGYNDKTRLANSVNVSATFHAPDNHINGTWNWNYDFANKHQLQQRAMVSYMSQCCGVAAEFQTYYIGAFNVNGIQQDRRFNLSFSLAGLGTFSNLLGSFSR